MQLNLKLKLSVFLYGLLALILGHSYYPVREVDPILNDYYTHYVDTVNELCPEMKYSEPNQMRIKFNNQEGRIIGVCRSWWAGWSIEIDSTFWSYAGESYKKALVMHEAAHCILGIDHNDVIKGHYMNSEASYTSPEMLELQMRGDIIRVCREKYVTRTDQ